MKKNSFFKIFIFSIIILFITNLDLYSKGKDGINKSNIDTTVSPAADFYEYAVGNWIKNTEIPAAYPSWGTLYILNNENQEKLKSILESEENDTNSEKGSDAQLIGDFYYSGMDSAKIDADGFEPIKTDLNKINSTKNLNDFYDLLTYIQIGYSNPFFALFPGADAKNSKMEIAQIFQSGLGMPDRDYYLKNDENTKSVRDAYKKYMRTAFILTGNDSSTADKYVEKVMELETKLAKVSMPRVEMRNPSNIYHKMTLNDLDTLSPNIEWKKYFDSMGVPEPGDINVAQPDYIKKVGEIIKETPLEDLKLYLSWNVINSAASYLSTPFAEAKFEFSGKTLRGVKAMQPRWKRVLGTINRNLGEPLGHLFVNKYFPPEAKQKALDLVHNLFGVLQSRIQNLDWMSEKTKEKALEKLNAITIKIGYPDKWRDFSKIDISRNSYFGNVLNASIFSTKFELAKIGKPVDKSEWHMNPQTVNAYYNPANNEIVFPAGILQSPIFDMNADEAMNYGGFGCVIGHETTHGFDDEGRHYDLEGNLTDWWTKDDESKFNKRAEKIVEQFDSYVPVDTFHINGKLTEGENIADLGGLSISYEAFTKTNEFKKGEKIDGFTPAQRFFLAYANIWKSVVRPQSEILQIRTNPHSPGKFRVDGPLSNLPGFWKAFNVKPGEPMRNPDNKLVKIW